MKTFTPKDRSEVDIQVAQELKNNRDFIYQTNQSLQNLSKGIEYLSLRHDQVLAKNHSNRNDLEIRFDNLQAWITARVKDMEQKLGDMQSTVFKLSDHFTALSKELSEKYVNRNEFIEVVDPMENRISYFLHEIEDCRKRCNYTYQMQRTETLHQIEAIKKELTPIIPEVDPVQVKIDALMNTLKVDFDGLVREIAILKRSSSYAEKKFENIYTLIERLKEGKQ